MKNLTKMITRMSPLKFSGILFILLITVNRMNLSAQPGLTVYADAGENTISDGLYIRSALLGHYRFGKNRLETGVQSNLINGNDIVLSGY